ncbi:MAG TPA: MFS transporter [Alphaproteobacteria bacterium]|nr:MFS transporter [Alphaproteobacteria bacterium]
MRRSYWVVIICGALVLTLSTGLRQTLGLFLKPMTFDLDVSRELFSFGIALQNILWGAAGPFAGAIADKYGTGRTLVGGGLLYAGGLLAMGLAAGAFEIVLGSALIGLGLSGVGFTVILGAVGRAAPPERRSMALGIVAAGGSFGQFVMVPYGQAFLEVYGWEVALLVLAATALIMVPLSWGVAGQKSVGGGPQSLRDALDEAMRHRGFWLLTAGFFVCGFQVVFVGTHLPAFLADQAMPAWLGGWALALVGLFNIVGTYTCGALGQRYRKKYVLAWLYIARSAAFIVFLAMPLSNASVLLFASVLGLLWLGTVPLTGGLVAQIFGPTYMSMLYGIVFFSHQIGSFLGAWLGGKLFDMTGSYDAMWWICVALGFAAAVLHWPIADRPVPRLAAAVARA